MAHELYRACLKARDECATACSHHAETRLRRAEEGRCVSQGMDEAPVLQARV